MWVNGPSLLRGKDNNEGFIHVLYSHKGVRIQREVHTEVG